MAEPRKTKVDDRILTAVSDGFLIQLDDLEAANAALREQVEGHAERIAAQSEILSRAAEKPLTRGRVENAVMKLFYHGTENYVALGSLVLMAEGEQKGRPRNCTEVTNLLWGALKGA